ncbi:retrovirus-related pol polyprotein from transposon TNT 1-94 [Tanacetum coccineum]
MRYTPMTIKSLVMLDFQIQEIHRKEHLDSIAETEIDGQSIPRGHGTCLVRQEQALVIQRNKRNAELVQENDLLKSTLSGKEKSIAFLQSEKEKILSEKKDLADKELSQEQAYWLSANEIARQASKPTTPATTFVHKSRPPSQVLASLQKVLCCFHQFEAKQFVEQQLVPFYDHFKKHIESANDTFFKEIKEYEQIFDELEAECEQLAILSSGNVCVYRSSTIVLWYLDSGMLKTYDPVNRFGTLKGIQSPEMFLLLQVVQIILWYLDSGCSWHMTGDRARLINFVEKFIGTVRFGNDDYAANFCDGGLEVAFRQHSCHIRNYDMVDLLKGSRTTNLYSISLNDMMSASPVCLLTKASSTKSWLWHRRLNHLNFGTLNELARNDLVRGLPMLKYDKDHLCPSCQLGKSKKASHPLKAENTNTEVLHTLHMDLCGPMRTESINGKKYVLVIVDDYTRFGWVRFLRTKDETPQVIEKFIVKTQRALNATVRFVRTDNGTEFVNKTLDGWFESVGISHETSVPRSPQQNGVVERRNRTLMEAARTMLIFAKAPLFLWAEAVATACYTLNRSLVHTLHGKTYYELLKGKKPNLQYFRVFGSLCYPTNDYDDVGKLKAKADIGIFVGYAPTKKAYRIYNKRTRKIQETVHVAFDELTEGLTSVQTSSGLAPQQMTSVPNSTELELTALQSGRSRSALVKDPEPPSVPPTKKQVDDLFQWFDDDEVVPIPPVVPITPVNVPAAPAPENANGSPSTTVISEGAPAVTESLLPHQIPLPDTSDSDVETLFDHVDSNVFDTYNAPETDSVASSSNSVNIDVTPNNQLPHVQKWTQAHPLENIIGDKDRPVSTRKQLETDAMWCFFNEFLTHVEPKTYKQALEHSCWIEAMQQEENS